MYTQELRKGFFSALPIYKVVKKDKFNVTLNSNEMKRINEIQLLATNVMIGTTVSLHNIQNRYIFIYNTYYSNINFMKDIIKYKGKEYLQLIQKI